MLLSIVLENASVADGLPDNIMRMVAFGVRQFIICRRLKWSPMYAPVKLCKLLIIIYYVQFYNQVMKNKLFFSTDNFTCIKIIFFQFGRKIFQNMKCFLKNNLWVNIYKMIFLTLYLWVKTWQSVSCVVMSGRVNFILTTHWINMRLFIVLLCSVNSSVLCHDDVSGRLELIFSMFWLHKGVL